MVTCCWAPATLFSLTVGCLQDYLAAPMPFLMGLHAPNLFMPTLRSGALEEVVIVDLDRGAMYNGPGQPLPKCALPWADQLRDAFDLLKQTLRSPLEHESTPFIISLMQACASWLFPLRK